MRVFSGAWPPFAPDGGLTLALTRGGFDAVLFVAAGASLGLFGTGARLVRVASVAGLALGVAWLVLAAGAMSGAVGFSGVAAAVPIALLRTWFGHVLAAQFVLLAGVGFLGARLRPAGAAMAWAALLAQALHGHAWAMSGVSAIAGTVAVHLASGGAWIGSLLPLLLAVRAGSPGEAGAAARRFSPLGRVCVVAMAATALWQAVVLSGSLAGLLGTAYGWVMLVKAGLFALLVAIAARNQFRLVPRLGGAQGRRAQSALAVSIGVEIGIGVAALAAAGVLAGLPPGMHAEPVWPFAQTVSLVTLREDAGFRNEVLEAAAAIGIAMAAAAFAFLLRRWRVRVAVWVGCCVVAGFALPHLDLLFVQAFPTSFQRSPTAFSADAIARGSEVFATRCASCHGADGNGHGVLASALAIPPDDLTSPMIEMHEPGELFWWIGHGIEGPDGRLAMPGFAASLSGEEIWDVIDDVHAHEAAVAWRAGGTDGVRAPGFVAECSDGERTLGDWRGRAVLLGVGAVPAALDAVRVEVGGGAARPGVCVADDVAVAVAYGIAAGISGTVATGTVFVIDRGGRLSAVLAPGAGRAQDAAALAAALARTGSKREVPAGMAMGMRM